MSNKTIKKPVYVKYKKIGTIFIDINSDALENVERYELRIGLHEALDELFGEYWFEPPLNKKNYAQLREKLLEI